MSLSDKVSLSLLPLLSYLYSLTLSRLRSRDIYHVLVSSWEGHELLLHILQRRNNVPS